MTKFTILFATLALCQAAFGCGTCGCGGYGGIVDGGFGGSLGGCGGGYIGDASYHGGYAGGYGIGGGISGGIGGYHCTPYTSCSTGTCARPVTVCQQAWQQYPCTRCSTGVSCSPTCSC